MVALYLPFFHIPDGSVERNTFQSVVATSTAFFHHEHHLMCVFLNLLSCWQYQTDFTLFSTDDGGCEIIRHSHNLEILSQVYFPVNVAGELSEENQAMISAWGK